MSFWQGVDVPGPALTLVVIDRIPFPRPDDPLMAARREAAGRTGFQAVDLPRAATLLAQGAGRLIRTATDRGVVAVLDPRLATASYGPTLVKALPPMRRTRDRTEAEAFLRGIHAAAAGAVAAPGVALPAAGPNFRRPTRLPDRRQLLELHSSGEQHLALQAVGVPEENAEHLSERRHRAITRTGSHEPRPNRLEGFLGRSR